MFVGLLNLLVLIGIVVLIVRAVGKGRAQTGESVGVLIRRLFQYLAMLAALALVGFGLAGVLEALFVSAEGVTDETDLIARSVAFLVVGVPVYVGLALYTRSRLRDDPEESRSFGWAAYLTGALVGSLVASIISAASLLGEALAGDGLATASLIGLVIWGLGWISHRWAADRFGDPDKMWVEHLIGSFTGLSVALASGAVSLGIASSWAYDSVFDVPSIGGRWDDLAPAIAIVTVAAVVWGWYWLRVTRREARRPLWTAYVLLAGVLAGVLMSVAGAATALFFGLDWFLGDTSESASSYFEGIPAALAVLVVGGASWVYHRSVLGTRRTGVRSEIDRVYDYLLAAVGLAVGVGGVATLIAYGVRALAGVEITGSDGSAIAVALTLLIVGAPLWALHWRRVQREWRGDPAVVGLSMSRRIYLPVVVGVACGTALVGLIMTIYLAVQDLVEGTFGRGTLDTVAVPVALVLATAGVGWYHVRSLLGDRATLTPAPVHAVREVILVSEDGEALASAMSAAHYRIRRLHASAPPSFEDSVEAVLRVLDAETHERVVVVTTGDRFEVLPLD